MAQELEGVSGKSDLKIFSWSIHYAHIHAVTGLLAQHAQLCFFFKTSFYFFFPTGATPQSPSSANKPEAS